MTYVRACRSPLYSPQALKIVLHVEQRRVPLVPSSRTRRSLTLPLYYNTITVATMKFLFVAATALATASAFTTSPAAFTTSVPQVGGAVNNVFSNEGNAHRNRRSTIVMDGKANGKYSY